MENRKILSGLEWGHISLWLVGLMWVLPFLYYYHRFPLPMFYQEWLAALLGVLALMWMVTGAFWRKPDVPRIVQMPIVLIALVLLQWALGKITYPGQALLYILYLLFAAFLMMLGAKLRDRFGMPRLAEVLAVFLLVGAELSALAGLLQHYRWNILLNAFVAAKTSSAIYGNLAQANHFANYILLGLISLGLLLQQRRIRSVYAVLLAVPLLYVLALSGSRSSWLYLALMVAIAWLWARRNPEWRPLLNYSLLLVAGFGAAHWVVQVMPAASSVAGSGGSVDTVQRMFELSATGGIRLYLWRESVQMFLQSPWLGVGFGRFAWNHFLMLPELQQTSITGLYHNAHNLVFQLAAESGIAGLFAVLVPLWGWGRDAYQQRCDSKQAGTLDMDVPGAAPSYWWGYSILGIIAIHSLLEYPLWYMYFMAIAAILLGALDANRYRMEFGNLGRISGIVIWVFGMAVLAQLLGAYRSLEQVRSSSILAPVSGAAVSADHFRENLATIYENMLLMPYAEVYMSSLIEINDDHLDEKLALNTRVIHFAPIAAASYRQVFLLAAAGQQEQAKTVLAAAIWSHPGSYGRPRYELVQMAEKDPARFSALLEFAVLKEQEYRNAVLRR